MCMQSRWASSSAVYSVDGLKKACTSYVRAESKHSDNSPSVAAVGNTHASSIIAAMSVKLLPCTWPIATNHNPAGSSTRASEGHQQLLRGVGNHVGRDIIPIPMPHRLRAACPRVRLSPPPPDPSSWLAQATGLHHANAGRRSRMNGVLGLSKNLFRIQGTQDAHMLRMLTGQGPEAAHVNRCSEWLLSTCPTTPLSAYQLNTIIGAQSTQQAVPVDLTAMLIVGCVIHAFIPSSTSGQCAAMPGVRAAVALA